MTISFASSATPFRTSPPNTYHPQHHPDFLNDGHIGGVLYALYAAGLTEVFLEVASKVFAEAGGVTSWFG